MQEEEGPYFLGVTHYSYGEGALAHSTVQERDLSLYFQKIEGLIRG